MTVRRRRGHPSDWVLALDVSRSAKKLRRTFPSSTEFTQVGSDAVSLPHVDCSPKQTSFVQGHSNPENMQRTGNDIHQQGPLHLSVECDDDASIPALDITEGGNIDEIDGAGAQRKSLSPPDIRLSQERSATNEPVPEHCLPPTRYMGQTTPNPCNQLEGISTHVDTPAERMTHVPTETQSCSGCLDATNTIDHTCHTGSAPSIIEKLPDIMALTGRRKKWEFRFNLTALVAVVGSVRFTVHQYEYTRDVLKDVSSNPDDNWPPYSKTQLYFKDIIEHCLPDSHIVRFPKVEAKNASFADSRESVIDPALDSRNGGGATEHGDVETERVRIFLPSSWARLDVATSVVFDDMYPDATDEELNSVNMYPIVRDRSSVTSACDSIMINHGGQCVPCGPGSEIEITVQKDEPPFSSPYQFSSEVGCYKFSAVITATWCVGARGHPNQSFRRAMEHCELSQAHRTIAQYFSEADERPSDTDMVSDIVHILPGDICTILSAHEATAALETNGYTAVLVHRFWRFEEGIPSMFISWVRISPTTAAYVMHDATDNHVVKELNLRRFSTRTRQLPTEHASHGKLVNGTPYVVYRILLYCDDFQRSSQHYPRGSAGGCYFLPLSLPPEKRRTTSAVRVISLTPPGVSTNQVLQYIIDDLVLSTTLGIDGATPDGSPVKIFIDVVGFVGDYPAAAAAVDVIGHVSRAPCTLCTFRRQHASATDGSKYGYTTDVHAGNSSFLRHAERHLSLREARISDPDANFLGMVDTERTRTRKCPLVDLCKEIMRKRERIPLTSAGKKVVPGLFDPYRCNIVAPDHLLTGLAKDVINTVFQCMPNAKMRADADAYICSSLRENGLLPQRTVYNHKTKAIHGMKLSELYCVLQVTSTSLRNVISSSELHHDDPATLSFSLLQKLQRLTALTYWDPKRGTDGEDAMHYLIERRAAQLSALKDLSKEYVQAVDAFCSKFQVEGAPLDKPNLHRLIELYEHTIPSFGHVREVMELVFESAHQPLKRGIARSNNHEPHIFACEHCVGNDWQGRIASLSREIMQEDSAKRKAAYRGLRRLLIGADADLLNDLRDKEFIADTDAIIEKQLTNALKKQFQRANLISNFAVDKVSTWKARRITNIKKISLETELPRSLIKQVITTAGRWILAVYPAVSVDPGDATPNPIKIFMLAKRVRENENGRQLGSIKGFDVISPNTVVQLYTTPEIAANKIVNSKEDPNSIQVFFAILAVLHRENDMVWLVCARCAVTNDYLRIERALDNNSFQIICVTSDVRRVGLYHVCSDDTHQNPCKVDTNKRTVKHSHSVLNGAKMYFQTRKEGYPPRQG